MRCKLNPAKAWVYRQPYRGKTLIQNGCSCKRSTQFESKNEREQVYSERYIPISTGETFWMCVKLTLLQFNSQKILQKLFIVLKKSAISVWPWSLRVHNHRFISPDLAKARLQNFCKKCVHFSCWQRHYSYVIISSKDTSYRVVR